MRMFSRNCIDLLRRRPPIAATILAAMVAACFFPNIIANGQEIVIDSVVTRGLYNANEQKYVAQNTIYVSVEESYLFCYFHLQPAVPGTQFFFTIDSAAWSIPVNAEQPLFLNHFPEGVRRLVMLQAKRPDGSLLASKALEVFVSPPIWTTWWIRLLFVCFGCLFFLPTRPAANPPNVPTARKDAT
jgi:hypothetical protein